MLIVIQLLITVGLLKLLFNGLKPVYCAAVATCGAIFFSLIEAFSTTNYNGYSPLTMGVSAVAIFLAWFVLFAGTKIIHDAYGWWWLVYFIGMPLSLAFLLSSF